MMLGRRYPPCVPLSVPFSIDSLSLDLVSLPFPCFLPLPLLVALQELILSVSSGPQKLHEMTLKMALFYQESIELPKARCAPGFMCFPAL